VSVRDIVLGKFACGRISRFRHSPKNTKRTKSARTDSEVLKYALKLLMKRLVRWQDYQIFAAAKSQKKSIKMPQSTTTNRKAPKGNKRQ